MGFYLRKSVKVGPLRFNLSKSGIGVSAGVKGFRVGSGPRGNYVHMGRGGLYYRATIPSASRPQAPSLPRSERYIPPQPESTSHDPLHEIDSGDVQQMTDSSSTELLQELNSKRKKPKLWPYPVVLGIIAFFISTINHLPGWVLGVVALTAASLTVFLYYRDQLRKTTVLFYELEPAVETCYQSLHDAFERLQTCAASWHIEAEGKVRDRKYHAGASKLIERKAINLTKGQPPYVKTNLSVPTLPAGRQTLYFFPDRLLVFDSSGVGAVSYDSLRVDVSQTRFIEDGTVPGDSQVVDRTWKYVNKKGGPDRRFKDNRELPIATYEELLLTSSSGLNELVQLSRIGVGSSLTEAVAALAKCCPTLQSGKG